MKKLLILMLTCTSIILCSCSSYRDMDKLLFVTSILLDIDEEGSPVIYFETFKPVRTTEKETKEGNRIIYKTSNRTVSEAINDLNSSSGSRVTLTHNKVILFTQKAAEYGLEDFLDLFYRGQESNVRTLIGIYAGNTQDFVNLNLQEEKQAGFFLFDLIKNSSDLTSKGVDVDLKEVFNQRLIGDQTNSIPIIAIKTIDGKHHIEVIGLGLVKKNNLIGSLYNEQPLYFNFLLNNASVGVLRATNPTDRDKFVTVRIMKYKINSNVYYDGSTLTVVKTLNVKTIFREAQGSIIFNKENMSKIQEELEKNIKNECNKLFEEYKEKGQDVFDIQEEFERKYPKNKVKNIIKDTELIIDVEVTIEGTTDIFDFKE